MRRNVNLGRNEKLGSLEISIVRKFAVNLSLTVIWQLVILTRTRNGELPFRPCSTFPLPDIAKITNRTKKENKKTSLFPVRVVNKECTYSGKEVPITL